MQLHALHYATLAPISINVESGVIRAIEHSAVQPTLIAAPGLVELQINGHGGLDFNDVPIAPSTLSRAVGLLQRVGVTTFLPAVITNTDDAIAAAMASLARDCDADRLTEQSVPGFHLEGPFISPEDGPRGAHERRFVRGPDFDVLRRWQDAAGGRIRLLTMSPEWPDAGRFIEQCVAAGIKISIGHTAATPQQIKDAVSAGARLSTHQGNGCHLKLPRQPNNIWEQLASDELQTTIIADGFHLPDAVIKSVLRVKGARAMLVSDAVSLCGMPPGQYSAGVGGRVVLTPQGKLHLADNQKLLAGSAQPLIAGVNHLLAANLASLEDAVEMAGTRPAAFLGLPQSKGLAVGAPADIVLFRRDSRLLQIEEVYKSGQRVH
jgi:N-acetylglucosamine-6-phosphate deacetylase